MIKVLIDRPLGSRHPEHDYIYPVNYGYLPNTLAKDGEEIDAYVIGENKPLDDFEGRVIALIIRTNDVENKLVVARVGSDFTMAEIRRLTDFQEQYFQTTILLANNV